MSLGFTFHQPGYFPAFNPLALRPTVETGYISTTVYPFFYKHAIIEFSIPVEWGGCTFDIYRGTSELGPWFKISNTPVTGTFFKDTTSMDVSGHRLGWYRVECRMPDGRRIQGPATTWENKRHNWVEIRAKEIERRAKLLLEKFTGVRSLIFRRKHYGQRCPNCWNPSIEKVMKDHCQVCFGTSFTGGYFEGVETLFQYDPDGDDAAVGYQGKVEHDMMNAWTVSYPNIQTFDLILRVSDMKLFRVEKTIPTELQTHIVRQTVSLTELLKECVEYKLVKQILPEEYL